ncbi:MAG: polysaccharide pyruvyl transferase family protein [Acetatifactor sp.]|nr:polysaccharide pyruvyl transferase family protein [Acetatifactor sp.]
MKIGIVTFHFVNNFGGALQAYALKTYLEDELHVDVSVINYENAFIRFTDAVRVFPITKNAGAFWAGIKTFSQRINRNKRFKIFREKHLNLTQRFFTNFGLKRSRLGIDKYICGSDQIWNPIITGGVDPVYYLDFVKDPQNTCAYAPSFGTKQISKLFSGKMAKRIGKIGRLSVRERRSCAQIADWTGRTPKDLIDPTFLISPEKWGKIAEYQGELPERYILVYIMQANYSVYEFVSQLKEKYQLKVVDISRYGYKPGYVDKTVIGIGPAEFVALFKNAEMVCTNSYHGLAFSLIFGKKMFLVPSKNFALRMMNLLEILDIDANGLFESDVLTEIQYDYEAVEKLMRKEREKSFEYLNDFINGSYED